MRYIIEQTFLLFLKDQYISIDSNAATLSSPRCEADFKLLVYTVTPSKNKNRNYKLTQESRESGTL